MEQTVNQNNINYRDQLTSRMQSKYPDRNYVGTDGTDGTDSLEQSIMESLDEYDAKTKDYESQIGGYREREDRLTNLFKTDSRSAAFLNTWVQTGNPAMAFRKIFGQDAFNAMQSEQGAQILADIEAEEAKNRAEAEAHDQEFQQNFQQSMADLDAWGNEKGLDDEGKVKVFMQFYDMLSDALNGKYDRNLFEMAWKAEHYDNDVQNARHEGEVVGRNANIKAQQRRRQESEAMPPALSGQGESVPEERSQKPQRWSDFLK